MTREEIQQKAIQLLGGKKTCDNKEDLEKMMGLLAYVADCEENGEYRFIGAASETAEQPLTEGNRLSVVSDVIHLIIKDTRGATRVSEQGLMKLRDFMKGGESLRIIDETGKIVKKCKTAEEAADVLKDAKAGTRVEALGKDGKVIKDGKVSEKGVLEYTKESRASYTFLRKIFGKTECPLIHSELAKNFAKDRKAFTGATNEEVREFFKKREKSKWFQEFNKSEGGFTLFKDEKGNFVLEGKETGNIVTYCKEGNSMGICLHGKKNPRRYKRTIQIGETALRDKKEVARISKLGKFLKWLGIGVAAGLAGIVGYGVYKLLKSPDHDYSNEDEEEEKEEVKDEDGTAESETLSGTEDQETATLISTPPSTTASNDAHFGGGVVHKLGSDTYDAVPPKPAEQPKAQPVQQPVEKPDDFQYSKYVQRKERQADNLNTRATKKAGTVKGDQLDRRAAFRQAQANAQKAKENPNFNGTTTNVAESAKKELGKILSLMERVEHEDKRQKFFD